MGNNATNIADNNVFSKDQTFTFADAAIVGHGMALANGAGLATQLWAGLKDSRSVAFADGIRDDYDIYNEFRAKGTPKERQLAAKVADWKKGSPLSTRLSECRTVAKWTEANAERAAEVYAHDNLKTALKFVRDAIKAEKAANSPEGDSDPAETVPATITVEANADAGAAILADIRAYLAAASEEDRLALLCELESIVAAAG